MTLRFLQPEMAIWGSSVPALAAFWFLHYYYKRRSRLRADVRPRFLPLSRRSTWVRDAAVLALALATTSLLVMALMRPQIMRERRTPEYERQDLILVLDRSVSMRARDIRPSRAERASAELKHFLQRKPEAIDRVGLVGFAGTSLVLSYLTRDVDSLLFYLDWITEDPSVFYGTDIGAALTSAMEVVTRDQKPSRKFFLVVSDGEDQGSTMQQALGAVSRAGIRIHAIGIGSHQESMIPITMEDGTETLLTDDQGRAVTTRFNESSLRSLTSATQGRYIRSVTGGELLTALDTIAHAGRVQTGWRTTTEYQDTYAALLAAAAIAVVSLVALL
jgi:Ca-activated chloride channel family protein